MIRKSILLTALIFGCFASAYSQKVIQVQWTTNIDESKVPEYVLPNPLLCKDGTMVTSKEQWESKRRPELVEMLSIYMYGKTPDVKNPFGYKILSVDNAALDGKATHKIVKVYLSQEKEMGPSVETHIYSPNKADKPSPAFMLFNIPSDVVITRFIDNGYGFACFKNVSVAADNMDAFSKGLIPYYYRLGQTMSYPDEWGTIAAWAWTASRILDYLESDSDINAKKVAVHGHSRLGKTALWAGAVDTRFAMVYPAGSGCCGAALSRRMFGETLFNANENFPHWLCGNFQQFSRREQFMPFDQHEVIALCAPRPVYIAGGEDDTWADPRGNTSQEELQTLFIPFMVLRELPLRPIPRLMCQVRMEP